MLHFWLLKPKRNKTSQLPAVKKNKTARAASFLGAQPNQNEPAVGNPLTVTYRCWRMKKKRARGDRRQIKRAEQSAVCFTGCSTTGSPLSKNDNSSCPEQEQFPHAQTDRQPLVKILKVVLKNSSGTSEIANECLRGLESVGEKSPTLSGGEKNLPPPAGLSCQALRRYHGAALARLESSPLLP